MLSRRQAREWFATGLLIGCAAAACSAAPPMTPPDPASLLFVTVKRTDGGDVSTWRYMLECAPPSGAFPHPSRACHAVADIVRLGRRAHLGGCAGVYTGPWVIVQGRFRGRRVHLAYGWLCGVTPRRLVPELRVLGTFRRGEG